MKEVELNFEQQIFAFIERLCGLTINEAHKNYMRSYINKRLEELNIDLQKFCNFVQTDDAECAKLINEAAINETYFFREEQQFDFLKNKFFPNFQGEKITIWSAACSTGEEPISLYALAKSCGKEPLVYATDIDTEALSVLAKGKYYNHSFRNDGKKYHALLEKIGMRTQANYELFVEAKVKIRRGLFNLITGDAAPVAKESVDLLFLRNVFIYFSSELRKKVIRQMADYLVPGGYLFLSVNDIAGTSCDDDVPLIKEHQGNIYYFKKVDMATKAQMQKRTSVRSGTSNVQRPMFNTTNSAPRRADRLASVAQASNGLQATGGGLIRGENKFPQRTSSYTREQRQPLTLTAKKQNVSTSTGGFPKQAEIENLAKKVFDDLGNKNYNDAKMKVMEYKFRPENLEYKSYFNGLIAEAENDDKTATQLFLRANLYEPKFWPSYFKLGLIYEKKGNNRESKKTFSICANLLENYIKEKDIRYNFLVEEFNPSYFLDVCRKYIDE